MLIKVLLLFCYCVSCKSVLLSLAPLSLEQYIKTNPIKKRKRTEKKFTKKQSQKKPKQYKSKRTEKKLKKYQCDLCQMSFGTSYNLNRHKKTHTGEKPFQCDLCEMSFAEFYHLKRHQKTHTGEKPFQCDLCEMSFAEDNNLNRHKKTHTGEKPFQCDLCEKIFSQSGNLARHKRTHTKEKPFQCNLCPMQFSRNPDYTKHKRTHTKEKPFQCDVCKKRFSQSGNLARHKRTHTKEKPFQCDQVSKNFVKDEDLTTHNEYGVCHEGVENSVYLKWHEQKKHTKKKNLLYCPLCDKSFAIGGRLYVHRRKHLHLTETQLSVSCEEVCCGEVYFDELELYLHSYLQHIPPINKDRYITIEYLNMKFFQFLNKLITSHSVSKKSFQNFLKKNEQIMRQLKKSAYKNMTKDQLLKFFDTMGNNKELESLLLADIIFLCLDVRESLRPQPPEKADWLENCTNILTDLTKNKLSHDEFFTVLTILMDRFYEKTVPSQIISIVNNPMTDRSA